MSYINSARQLTPSINPTTVTIEDDGVLHHDTDSIQYRFTPTGRVTLTGTRSCKDCGRKEFHTKKYEKSGNVEDLNTRYTLCKGICVYCYNTIRRAKNGTSLNVAQLEAKIAEYTAQLKIVKGGVK